MCQQKVDSHKKFYESKFKKLLEYKKLILITGHRRKNFSNETYAIIEAIKELAIQHPLTVFYYPVHLRPVVQKPVHNILGNLPNVILDNPLPYDELVFVMSKSYLIMTDSGGIQEEGPTLNIPIIVLRDTTERPEGIQTGCAVLAGTKKENIIHIFNNINEDEAVYNAMSNAINPYGNGTSCQQIVDILEYS